MVSHGGISNLSNLQESIQSRMAEQPGIKEIIPQVIGEIGRQFTGLYPLLKAIGWTVIAYFIILIVIALIKFKRSRKHIKLLEEMNSTLKEIKEKLPDKKSMKKKNE